MGLVHFLILFMSISSFPFLGFASYCLNDYLQQSNRQFEQKTDRFWQFNEQSSTWVEVQLPYELLSCVNGNCTKVGSIDQIEKEEDCVETIPQRRRLSLIRMSETSIWITGESGSIFERFWNGVQWVYAPHDLPVLAGPATGVFIVNQTILALSESGVLYQMQISENWQPIWVPVTPNPNSDNEAEVLLINSGSVSHDGMRVYFCTKKGLLLELAEVEPLRWINHGRPPGGNVAAIADAGVLRPEVVYTISSAGDLYEYDKNSKPSWKKHIWAEAKPEEARLLPSNGIAINSLTGNHSASLFLLTKAGKLVERRLNQRKWKWIVHGSLKDHQLTSITPSIKDESSRNFSLFFSTSTGSVLEYGIPKNSGSIQEKELWINHEHPINAKVARGISGLPIQPGRVVFALNDGRLAELHLPGLGGENIGPNHWINSRRKSAAKLGWSVLDVPETEGWNAEYCREERGPMNCVAGAKDDGKTIARRRKGGQMNQNQNLVAVATESGEISEEIGGKVDKIGENFRLRVMQGGKSFFLITGGGLAFEYLNTDEVWLWLRHDFPAAIKAAVGNYNGSLFLVDGEGNLIIRERSGDQLTWLNCSAMRKGKKVASGPPWDGIPGKPARITPEDALFFVGKNGRLIQFTVALRKFKWKDCRNPRGTKIAAIVDQELFRGNIVFVIGMNGRLYQYNKVTELWHEHHQSRHLRLAWSPGTAAGTAEGSVFMISAEGGLVEYNWNAAEGWNWVEHGPPEQGVVVAAPPSPCFEGNQLFLIGSNGEVYMRLMEDSNWKWKNCGFPHWRRRENGEICIEKELLISLEKEEERLGKNRNCDSKVASTRPMPFSDDSVIFELRDGRLAEMRRIKGSKWAWSRIIGTPTSLCLSSYWTAVAS